MTREEFREYVRAELQTLPIEDVRRFARLCAIRALPFLSVERGFVYWPEESRQIHLQSIFYAIDIIGDSIVFGTAINALANANAAIDANTAATNAALDTNAATNAAAFAANTAAFAANANANVTYATSAASNAAANVTYAAYATQIDKNFRDIITNDLMSIKHNKLHTIEHDVSIYGEIWTDFQDSLHSVGCGYWVELYQNIFDSQFQIDEVALRQRLEVPESIRAEGAAAVAYYLESMAEQGEKGMNEVRIILLGDKGAGKTSLSRKLRDPEAELPDVKDSTQGVDVNEWILHDDLRAHIWDFAGHFATHTAHRFFLAESCVYVVVYNGREEKVRDRSEIEYWINQIVNYGGNSPVYILINEFDSNPINIDEYGLQDKYPFIRKVIRMSLANDTNAINDFRNQLEQLIGDDTPLNKAIPVSWFKIKEELANQFKTQNKEHITVDDFQKIAKKSKIKKDIEKVRGALHALGICLYYGDIEGINTYVLNPTWITYGIYKIIDWMSKNGKQGIQAKGMLRKHDLESIFVQDAERYPEDKYDFLIGLMLKYELAYPVKDKPDAYILPLALPLATPKPQMEKAFVLKEGSLLFRYVVTGALPPDTITRFIVRHHKNIASEKGKQIVWRYGVFLLGNSNDVDDVALIVEDGLTIRVAVKGPKAKQFAEYIKSTLGYIFSKYKSDDPTLEYAVADDTYLAEDVILSFSDSIYYDSRTRKEIPMRDTIERHGLEHPKREPKTEEEPTWWRIVVKIAVVIGLIAAIATIIYNFSHFVS